MEIAPAPAPASTTSSMLPDRLRLGAVRLVVTDLDRSVEWYERIVGVSPIERPVEGVVRLGTHDGTVVLEIEEDSVAQRAGRHAGLYHVALLYPSRTELARSVRRIAASRTMIDGASDHGTHEAIYLSDPDGNGLELAADRPRAQWPNLADVEAIRPRPLDLHALLALVVDEPVAPEAAAGLSVGHLHLHVGDVAAGIAFWRDIVGFELIVALDVAAFVAAGGYHHHLAFNTWKGVGVPPQPDGVVGLRFWSIVLPSAEDVDELEQRLIAADAAPRRDSGGALIVRDPWNLELRVDVDD